MQGDYVNSLSGKSSLFRLHVKLESRVFRYDVNIEKVFPEGTNTRSQIMTKQSDTHFRNFDALICRKMIELMHKEINGLGSGRLDHNYVYDGKGALYSLHNLDEGGKRFFEARKVNETHPEIRMKPGVRVTFAITPNAAYPVLDYSDFKETQMKEEDTEMPDQSVRTFLELVTDAQRRQGTAHLTQYTVFLNEMEIPMLKLQEFMLMLVFMHQVSVCPTSLPSPVYLVSETAKRR